jgi:hypothetical protein
MRKLEHAAQVFWISKVEGGIGHDFDRRILIQSCTHTHLDFRPSCRLVDGDDDQGALGRERRCRATNYGTPM